MQHPLLEHLGHNLTSVSLNEILRGNIELPPGTNRYKRELLQEMRQVDTLTYPAPAPIVTTSDFREGWGEMKERTSSGISGLHFGHMKAVACDPRLSDFEVTLAHLPYCSGYVPKSWRKGICCMLKKKPDIDHITKLRTIVLTEADYNFNNKTLTLTQRLLIFNSI